MAENAIVKQSFDFEKVSTQKEDELFYFVENDSVSSEKITAVRYSYWRSVMRIFFKKKINWIMLGLLAFILLMSIFFPIFNPYDEMENVLVLDSHYLSPTEAIAKYGFSLKWLFGTGQIGNSIFYGMWASAATSIALSFICAFINMALGIVIGAVWGYSKTLDSILNIVYIINLLLNLFFVLTFKDLSFIFFVSGLFLTSFVIYEIYRLKRLVN